MKHYFNVRTFGSIFCYFITINIVLCQDLVINSIPESYPGALDGRLEITVQDVGFGSGQNPPPFSFSLSKLDEDPKIISNNSGVAVFTNLEYDYYCLSIINGTNCQAISCFQFDEPCATQGCLVANFNVDFTVDGCTVQFEDWSEGIATSWSWDFGDGATSNLQHPFHTYSESKCYYVSLVVSDGAISREFSKEVCVTACNGLNAPPPACQINAPTVAAAGQPINLGVAPVGIAPFLFEWSALLVLHQQSNGVQRK